VEVVRGLIYCNIICMEKLRKTTKTSVSIVGLRAEILTWDLPNTKQECQSCVISADDMAFIE
jgi:hypothetical protein